MKQNEIFEEADGTEARTEAITDNGGCSTSDIVERKKKSVIWIFFAVNKEDKSTAICLTCNEKVSQGGSYSSIAIGQVKTDNHAISIEIRISR